MENFDLNLLDESTTSSEEVLDTDTPEEVVEITPEVKEEVPALAKKTDSVIVAPVIDNSSLTPREIALLERLERLTGEKLESINPPPQLEMKEVPKDEFDFIGDGDIDEVLSSKENLNKLLQGVYQRGLSEASKLSAESIMQSLPRIVTQYISQHIEMRDIVGKFYEENSDLIPVKRTVAAVANEIAAANPDLSTEEVFKRTAQQTRVLLRLRDPSSNIPKPKSNPALVGQKKGRNNIPALDGLAKEISELIDL